MSGKISKQVGCISCFTHGVWEIPFIYRFSKLMLDDTLRETRDFSIAIVISLLVLLMKDQVTNLQNFIVESVTQETNTVKVCVLEYTMHSIYYVIVNTALKTPQNILYKDQFVHNQTRIQETNFYRFCCWYLSFYIHKPTSEVRHILCMNLNLNEIIENNSLKLFLRQIDTCWSLYITLLLIYLFRL